MSQNSKGTCDDLFIKLLYHFVKSIKLTRENNKVQFPRDFYLFLIFFQLRHSSSRSTSTQVAENTKVVNHLRHAKSQSEMLN